MLNIIKRTVALLITTVMICPLLDFSTSVSATDEDDAVIVVSLGDSYSSGEGIEPFYFQEQDISQKAYNHHWLAHRSKNSWPSQIKIPGVSETTGNYDVIEDKGNDECKWYFTAVSGAETKHMKIYSDDNEYKGEQKKIVWKNNFNDDEKFAVNLPNQLSIFEGLTGKVDYVTMSVGGNDINFSSIVTNCFLNSTHLNVNLTGKSLDEEIKDIWDQIETTKNNIRQVYKDVQKKAGNQATIIVAGYPKLFEKEGKGGPLSKKEAETVNKKVGEFNEILSELVDSCRKEGLNIYFVDVQDEFESHEAYSEDAWINKIIIGPKSQDLHDFQLRDAKGTAASNYSVHPNKRGAEEYAKCVNSTIDSLGMLSGKVVKASDRISPIKEAKVTIYQNNIEYATTTTDATGNYQMRLPEGDYKIKITADGYIEFNAYATITRQEVKYMETFLMVEGSEDEIGNASGKVFDGLTGNGINDVTLTIRKGWNTPENDENDVIKTIKTNSNGSYSVELPYGNYTVYAAKDGYISTTFNIISQKGTTSEQNGTMSSAVLGDGYRIILTWDEYPEDLDSHVVGKLSDGGLFHVYYEHMSQYDGKTEVCNLDVDDITSYGPETITLTPTTTSAYYYYIYRYSGSQGTVGSSGAQIKLYKGETLINTFNVPTNLGESDYWNVFAIKNGEPIIKNTITSSADTSYAE